MKKLSLRAELILRENFERLLNRILSEDIRGKKVLDAGCGDAKFFPYIIKREAEYVGVDINIIRKDTHIGYSPNHRKPAFVRCDVHHLPFRDKCFDILIARELIYHVKDPVKTILEVYRTSKRVIIIEANKYAPYMIWAYYNGHKHFSHNEFKNILRKALGYQPFIYMVGVYAYRNLCRLQPLLKKFFMLILATLKSIITLRSKKEIATMLLKTVFYPTILLEEVLFIISLLNPSLFFSSKVFKNRILGLEMVFDSKKQRLKSTNNLSTE